MIKVNMGQVTQQLISINIHKTNKVFETLGEKIIPYYICTNLWVMYGWI